MNNKNPKISTLKVSQVTMNVVVWRESWACVISKERLKLDNGSEEGKKLGNKMVCTLRLLFDDN